MTLIVPWLVFPIVFGTVCWGSGLLVQVSARRPLPGALVLPVGFAAVVVVSSLTTALSSTARLTTPVVVVVALAGFALSVRSLPRPDPWAIGAALGVFGVYAAPIVFTGVATWGGYLTLDDTSTWLALAENALQHGRSIGNLPLSSYSVPLEDYLSTGYPLGSFLPLGIGHQLTRADEAWLFQPQIAFLAAMLSLAVYSLSSRLVSRRWLRAIVAFVGPQSALLFGYAFWSGIKESTTATLVALLAALIVSTRIDELDVRRLFPLAVCSAAVLDSVSVSGAIWFAALGALGCALVWFRLGWGVILAGCLAAMTLVLGAPSLAIARSFVNAAQGSSSSSSGSISSPATLGNLLHPLSNLQVFGIWPTGDFRTRPADMQVTYVLIGTLAAAGLAGLAIAWRKRSAGVPLYLATALVGGFAVVLADKLGHSSPWVVGKALAIASPAVVVAGIAGAAALFETGRRVEAAVAAAAIVVGVGWSNALRYENVWLAPHGQFAELQTIGTRFAGQGPALMTEFQPYGVRHFLRALAPEGASERRARPDYLRNGEILAKLQYADLDDFALSTILVYRTLVLRTSPLESRPPSIYHLVWKGHWYEVWERPVTPKAILEHLPLGTDQEPVAVPDCSAVKQLASLAAAHHGTLVAAQRPAATTYDLNLAAHPPGWGASGGGSILPGGAGTVTVTISVPGNGSYGFWVAGSFRHRLQLLVDGSPVAAVTNQLNEQSQLTPFGTAQLSAGAHQVKLVYGARGLRPGTGSYAFAFGPLVVGLPATDASLLDVSPAAATSLCGRTLDWIEAVAP